MKRPLFSCVVPVKGKRPYFDVALASLQTQGMGGDLEVIVQDGDVESDCGQSDAFNKGFAKARGEWLFWLNADDILLPGALSAVAAIIQQHRDQSSASRLMWIVGNQMFIDAEGRVVKCVRANGWHDWLYRNAVPHVNGPSSFFRRELLEKVGKIDESLRFCMDWDLWIRFMRAGACFERLDRYVWQQRQWSGSKTQRRHSPDEAREHREEVARMLRKNAFEITRWGVWKLRLWRTLNGNFARSAWDTLVRRGT